MYTHVLALFPQSSKKKMLGERKKCRVVKGVFELSFLENFDASPQEGKLNLDLKFESLFEENYNLRVMNARLQAAL